ncbi:MAG: DUF424 family protein [Candidatus Micrarchaeota archaeon]|nr:DUF424 family protein [Candidatus Micrarchaeota archaeon]
MYLKRHSSPAGEVVAICDEELLGRVLQEGKIRIDLERYSAFYKGEKVSHSQAVAVLREAKNANIVGEKALRAAGEAGLDTSGARRVGGVPHLQVYQV